MIRFAISALCIGAVGLASGCFIVVDDDDDGGDLLLSWTTDPDCPPGANTAELVAAPSSGSRPFTDLFNCTDGIGEIADLPPGIYDVFINITDDSRNTVFATSFAERDVEVFDGDVLTIPRFDILTEDAFFEFAWLLTDSGIEISCDEVPRNDVACTSDGQCADLGLTCDTVAGICRGAPSGINVIANLMGSTDLNTTTFDCEDGSGRTDAFPLGTYTAIEFSVVDPASGGGEESFLTTDPIDSALTIGNAIADLGTIEFAF